MNTPSIKTSFKNTASGANGKAEANTLAPYSIRFTTEERARLDKEAGNRPLSLHIRSKLFGDSAAPRKSPARKPSVDDAALAKALSALGRSRLAANMNQLAKATHMGRLTLKPDAAEELSQACADIAVMRSALMTALGLRTDE